jgi:hypothetical protein
MELTTETKLDFDQTVSDEDRFAIRRVLDSFAEAANNGDLETMNALIADSTVIEGFSDLPYIKQEFISIVSRWQSRGRKHIMRFPKLKLSYSHYLYHLVGTYEEFIDNILAIEGTIELSMIKREEDSGDEYQLVKIVFYPRMRLSEE